MIYKADIKDSQKLKNLRYQLVKENPRAYGDTLETEASKTLSEYTNWIKQYKSSGGAILLLEVDGKIIGMGAIKKQEGSDLTAYMGSLGVLKAYQGKGYGLMLIAERLKLAKELGYTVVETITTKENERMLSILKKYGFKIIGEGEYKNIPEYYLELKL